MVSRRVAVVTAKLCHIRFTLYLFLLVLLFLLTVSLIFFSRLDKSSDHYYHPLIKTIRFALNNLPHLNRYEDADSDEMMIGNSDYDVKRILFWTPFFRVKDYGLGIGRDVFAKAKCPVNNCETTTDRNVLNQSDAVIFHPINVNVKDLPRHRAVHQRYIFLFFEAHQSYRSYPVFQNDITNVNFFNWTMTYRRDSDVYDPRYGNFLRRRLHQSDDRIPVTLSPEESPPDPSFFWHVNELIHPSSLSNRTKLVAWFVTNCKTPSQREVFFRQMTKYITIDIYGGCGPLKCIRGGNQNCDKLLDDYKFYIAAENSICPDYITEKFYRALEMGVVPVVYGGGDYSAYAPPHSYINAADFESPQSLAEYLLLLDRNPRLYAKYLDWNKDWEVNKRKRLDGWCRLCEKLNAPKSPLNNPIVKIYENMAKWFYDKVPCLSGTYVMQKYNG